MAETAPDEQDPRLRGRTYAIPFDRVWEAARALANGGLRRWQLIESDDYEGIIRATSTTFALRHVDDVVIWIGLDEDAQTRVDVRSASRKGVADLGTNARRIGRFLRALDKQLVQGSKRRGK
jgi:uncharacterized protein (DUF1499 family)